MIQNRLRLERQIFQGRAETRNAQPVQLPIPEDKRSQRKIRPNLPFDVRDFASLCNSDAEGESLLNHTSDLERDNKLRRDRIIWKRFISQSKSPADNAVSALPTIGLPAETDAAGSNTDEGSVIAEASLNLLALPKNLRSTAGLSLDAVTDSEGWSDDSSHPRQDRKIDVTK